MRIRLEFTTEICECPNEYRRSIISFMKNALAGFQDGKKFQEYYHDTCQKDFTWCTILPDAKFVRDKVILSDNHFTVIISTDDKKQTGFYLMAAFIKQKGCRYPMGKDNRMTLRSVKQLRQEVIVEDKCRFISMPGSPIVVREHDKGKNTDQYYTIEDTEFNEKLMDCLRYQLKIAGFDENMTKNISIDTVNCKKIVVKHYGIYIDTTSGEFDIKAPAIILQHIYQNGLASRKSAGFGMLDILK